MPPLYLCTLNINCLMLCEKKSIALKNKARKTLRPGYSLRTGLKCQWLLSIEKCVEINCQVHGEIILPQQPQQPQQVSLKSHKIV